MPRTGIAFLAAALGVGCSGTGLLDNSASGGQSSPISATSPSSTQGATTTDTFYWATISVTAPGFAGPPADRLIISLDGNGELHYLSWDKLPMTEKVFGSGPDEYPLSGTKTLTEEDNGYQFQVNVLENPAPTSDHFLLSYHVVGGPVNDYDYDYVETTEGTRSGAGWAVTYSMNGTWWGAAINANGSGTLYAGDPNAPAPVDGQPVTWSAPVFLTAPGFYGPPVDFMTVKTGGDGQLQSVSFVKAGFLDETFSSGTNVVPVSGMAILSGDTVDVVSSDPLTADHFGFQYHVHGTTNDDYVEAISGTRTGNSLAVQYSVKGTYDVASIDAHAEGTLDPATP